MKQKRKHKIPSSAHPLVKRIIKIINDQQEATGAELLDRAGLARNTLHNWRLHKLPSINNFEALANALEYDVVLIPRVRSKS